MKTLLDNLIVEDLCVNKKYMNLWESVLNEIANSQDDLKENYLNLHPEMFLSLPVVIKDNSKIICFSGLQINEEKWGKGIGRISSRMWIDSSYRFVGMKKFNGGNKFLNSYYCLPLQFLAAKKFDLRCLFVSRQHNPQGLQEFLKLIKINCDVDFEYYTQRYNVCGKLDPVPETCKQYVGVCGDKLLWEKNMNGYKLVE